MTIVDSINGVTSALGGDPKEANTIQEAIDAFKPVIVEKTSGGGGGGGTSFGTAVVDNNWDENSNAEIITVTMDGLISFNDFIDEALRSSVSAKQTEGTLVSFYTSDAGVRGPYKDERLIGVHGFVADTTNYKFLEYITCDIPAGSSVDYPPLNSVKTGVYRIFSRGTMGNWMEFEN